MSEFSDHIRKEWGEAGRLRDALLTTPEDVERYDNIVYGHDDREIQVLDVYRPKQAEKEDLPVIISVHGGGWIFGDKELYQYYCMSLAQRGFAVVNFTYRLAPEHKYPAALEDLNLVCKWVMKRAGRYHFNTERIFAVGDSAGAHLLGLYAGICTNPRYREQYDFTIPEGFALTAIALSCGIYDFSCADGEILKMIHEFMPQGATAEELEKVNVLNTITDVYPPVFCMTAVDDYQKVQVSGLIAKLIEKDNPFEFRLFGDKVNRLDHNFQTDIKTLDAAQCNDAQCDFFREFCF